MKEKFNIRLEKAMQLRNIKASELSEKANIPKSAISQYLSGLYEAKQKSIFKLANVLNVSEGWLMGLDVPMERDLKTDEIGNPIASIPILGTVKAGYNYLAQENWIGSVDIDKSIVGNGQDYFALKVHGDSMSPVLMENDIVVVKKQDDFENGEIVVALINGEEATIKKAYKGTTGIELKAINPYYPPRVFTEDEIKTLPVTIIGTVKQLKRVF
ncbi:MAG: helix-turn-helix domain-containing protein [Clostridia bacterium]|nr:helix-turn-helix domain-containing protein [Clostridia bacterium]